MIGGCALTNPYLSRVVHRHVIQSSYIGPRDTLVYLPPGYNELISYPVLYTQDGEEFFNLGRIATQTNQLILENEIAPLIIVGVFTDKRVRTEEYGLGYSQNAEYVNFFMKEVIPFVESNYPVRTDRNQRVLTGDSLGATVSMTLALRHPEAFANVLSLSGAFFSKSKEEVNQVSSLNQLKVYQWIGTEETSVNTPIGEFNFLEANRLYHELLISKGAQVKFVENIGDHTWGAWQKELPDGLRYFFGNSLI
jgi:enterochelin esterase-like enzyme